VDFVRKGQTAQRSGEIAEALKEIPQRTLPTLAEKPVESGRLVQVGKGRAARYRLPVHSGGAERKRLHGRGDQEEEKPEEVVTPLSAKREDTRISAGGRSGKKSVGYNRQFLDGLSTQHEFFYLSPRTGHTWRKWQDEDRGPKRLEPMRSQILHRLLIDLSWNSSRLEAILTRCSIPPPD